MLQVKEGNQLRATNPGIATHLMIDEKYTEETKLRNRRQQGGSPQVGFTYPFLLRYRVRGVLKLRGGQKTGRVALRRKPFTPGCSMYLYHTTIRDLNALIVNASISGIVGSAC